MAKKKSIFTVSGFVSHIWNLTEARVPRYFLRYSPFAIIFAIGYLRAGRPSLLPQ